MSQTKRQQQAAETNRKIFQAAKDLLDEKDFESITIREIVKRANVSIGTFYHYYKTKLDVFYETYSVADEYFETVVWPSLVQSGARERIYVFFDNYASYQVELTNPQLTSLLYNPDNRYFNRNGDYGIINVLTRVLEDGINSGEIRTTLTASQLALYLMIAVRGLVYHWCTMCQNYCLSEAMKKYVDFLLEGLHIGPPENSPARGADS